MGESWRLTQPGEDVLYTGGEDAHWRAAQNVAAEGEDLEPGEAGQAAGQLCQQVVVQQHHLRDSQSVSQ